MTKFPYTLANRTFDLIKEHRILYQFVVWDGSTEVPSARVFSSVEKHDLPKDFENLFMAPVDLIHRIMSGKKSESMQISSIIKLLEDHHASMDFGIEQTFTPWSVEDEYNLLLDKKLIELLDVFDENGLSYFGKVILGIENNDGAASVIYKALSSYKACDTGLLLRNIGILVNSSEALERRDAAEELRHYVIGILNESRFA